MIKAAAVGAMAVALAGPAGAAQNPNNPNATTTQRSTAPQTASADQKFVADAAKDGTAEVELASLAAEKATSSEVKQFAQRMTGDHSKANDELKSLAQSKNI